MQVEWSDSGGLISLELRNGIPDLLIPSNSPVLTDRTQPSANDLQAIDQPLSVNHGFDFALAESIES